MVVLPGGVEIGRGVREEFPINNGIRAEKELINKNEEKTVSQKQNGCKEKAKVTEMFTVACAMWQAVLDGARQSDHTTQWYTS